MVPSGECQAAHDRCEQYRRTTSNDHVRLDDDKCMYEYYDDLCVLVEDGFAAMPTKLSPSSALTDQRHPSLDTSRYSLSIFRSSTP